MERKLSGIHACDGPPTPIPKPWAPTPPVQLKAETDGRSRVFVTLPFLEFKNKRGLILIVQEARGVERVRRL